MGEAWGGGSWRAGKGGDGGGHQKAVWEPFQTFTTGLMAGDEGGGMGGGVGRWPMEGGQGGRWGESSVGATKGALVPFFGLP